MDSKTEAMTAAYKHLVALGVWPSQQTLFLTFTSKMDLSNKNSVPIISVVLMIFPLCLKDCPHDIPFMPEKATPRYLLQNNIISQKSH